MNYLGQGIAFAALVLAAAYIEVSGGEAIEE